MALNCEYPTAACTEVNGWKGTFNYYVGHDEPSTLFYSDQPGSGYQMTYGVTLPTDPGNPTNYSTASTAKTYNLQLHPAIWFGMAMCDTQSYPQQDLQNCVPDSDSNITPDTFDGLSHHAGQAYMELQFFPPGDNHQPDAVNPCAVGQAAGDNMWCAAMTIDSMSEDPIHGTELNSSCQSIVGSPEYVNYGLVTTTGATPGPANPISSTEETYMGSPTVPTLFMNSGDKLQVTFNDISDNTPGPNGSGLQVMIDDLTTGAHGSMVSSIQNGFGMVQYAPPPSTACNAIPYNFHPMYNTADKGGRVTWAAHTYNIAFSDEIGHWDTCSTLVALSACNQSGVPGVTEGTTGDQEPSDADDTGCFPPSAVGTLPVNRCIGTNGGFDGPPYQNVWPTSDAPSSNVPTPFAFTSPLTGGVDAAHDTLQYSDVAFETDLPRVEGNDLPGTVNNCQRQYIDNSGATLSDAGQGCYLTPLSDDSTVAQPVHASYPWFVAETNPSGCTWEIGRMAGNGTSISDFGQNNQYGALAPVTYLSGDGSTPSTGTGTIVNFEDFRNDLNAQPCPANPAAGGSSPPPVAPATTYYLHQDGCGATSSPPTTFLDTTRLGHGDSGDGCGTFGGVPIDELLYELGSPITTSYSTFSGDSSLPLTVDGTRPVTGSIATESWTGVVGGAGTVSADVHVTAIDTAGVSHDLGSTSASTTATPTTTTYVLPFTLAPVPGDDGIKLASITISVVLHGVNENAGATAYKGSSLVSVPTHT